MPRLVRCSFLFGALFLAAPDSISAAFLQVSVFCPDVGVVGKSLTVSPPVGESVSCDNSFAGVSGSSADSVFVSANGNAEAFYRSLVELTFSGGTGQGFYVPCLSVNYASSAGSGGVFGPIALSSKFPPGGTCLSPLNPESRLPFTFGVPQQQTLFLDAAATSYGSLIFGSASASFNGFLVYDAAGNPLPAARWTTIDRAIPEPGLFVPALAAMIFSLRYRRVRAA